MSITKHIAKNFSEVHFGGNWTCSNLKDNLSDITWQQATQQVYNFNTIATLAYHIHYYVGVAMKVLQGEALNGKDELSFSHPPIHNQEDWENLLHKIWDDAETFAKLIELLPENKLFEDFTDTKYGSYYRNLHGIIEHTHYHLGQIALIKKIILSEGYN